MADHAVEARRDQRLIFLDPDGGGCIAVLDDDQLSEPEADADQTLPATTNGVGTSDQPNR